MLKVEIGSAPSVKKALLFSLNALSSLPLSLSSGESQSLRFLSLSSCNLLANLLAIESPPTEAFFRVCSESHLLPIGIKGVLIKVFCQSSCREDQIAFPTEVCLIAQKSRNHVIPSPKSIITTQERLRSPLLRCILINPRIQSDSSLGSTSNPEISLSTFAVLTPPLEGPEASLPKLLFRALIKTKEMLTAKEIKTGAIRSFMSQSIESHSGSAFPPKIFNNAINGDSAIAIQRIPTLAKSTTTRAINGKIKSTENPVLISARIKSCHTHKSLYPERSAKLNIFEYRETKGQVIDFPLLMMVEREMSVLS